MTLAATSPTITYAGNGSTATYSFPFSVFQAVDLQVTVYDVNGNPTTLVLNTDYSVSGLDASGVSPNVGSIVLINAGQAWLSGGNLASGYSLVIARVMVLVQNTSIRNQGDYLPEVIENSLDRLTMMLQQLQSGVFVVTDIVTGKTYRVLMSNGVLSTQEIT